MNAEDVLALVRAGYSRAEIDAMNAPAADPEPTPAPAPDLEPAPAADPEPAPAADDDAPAWAAALQKSIENLTRATQKANVLFDDMGGEADRETKANAALGEYITGKKANKK